MTTPTPTDLPEALRPEFGSLLRNTMAGESNPRRDAYFIREVRRSAGAVNPGLWFEMTDGHGETWLSNPKFMVAAHKAPQEGAPARSWIMTAFAELDGVETDDGNNCLKAARGALDKALLALGAGDGFTKPQAGAESYPPSEDEGTLLDYAMFIAHERELHVLGHKHDSDGAVLRFRSAVRRAFATVALRAQQHDQDLTVAYMGGFDAGKAEALRARGAVPSDKNSEAGDGRS